MIISALSFALRAIRIVQLNKVHIQDALIIFRFKPICNPIDDVHIIIVIRVIFHFCELESDLSESGCLFMVDIEDFKVFTPLIHC